MRYTHMHKSMYTHTHTAHTHTLDSCNMQNGVSKRKAASVSLFAADSS